MARALRLSAATPHENCGKIVDEVALLMMLQLETSLEAKFIALTLLVKQNISRTSPRSAAVLGQSEVLGCYIPLSRYQIGYKAAETPAWLL